MFNNIIIQCTEILYDLIKHKVYESGLTYKQNLRHFSITDY